MPALDASFSREQIRSWQDGIFIAIAWGLGLLGFILPMSIILFLCYHGAQAITWELLWQSPKGFPLGSSGGIRPAIEGSLALVATGLSVALPLALGAAIYLTAWVWLKSPKDESKVAATLMGLKGVEAVLPRRDADTVFGELEGPMEELERGYRSHGSLHESDIPLVIYNSSVDLPPPEAFTANLDLTRHIVA
jgi:hypothetical protein